MKIENKFPTKDISEEDLKNKFPLVAKKNSTHQSKFEVAGVEFGGDLIPIFAGPNMVESRELIFDVATNVKKNGAHFLRGGAFKPLTFPYRSEKYTETREEGIKWLNEVKKEIKIPRLKLQLLIRYLDSMPLDNTIIAQVWEQLFMELLILVMIKKSNL